MEKIAVLLAALLSAITLVNADAAEPQAAQPSAARADAAPQGPRPAESTKPAQPSAAERGLVGAMQGLSASIELYDAELRRKLAEKDARINELEKQCPAQPSAAHADAPVNGK